MAKEPLLQFIGALQGTIDEIGAKQRLIRNRVNRGKSHGQSRNELDSLNNATLALFYEMRSINLALDLVENLV